MNVGAVVPRTSTVQGSSTSTQIVAWVSLVNRSWGPRTRSGIGPTYPYRGRRYLRAAAAAPARRPKNEPSPSEMPLT